MGLLNRLFGKPVPASAPAFNVVLYQWYQPERELTERVPDPEAFFAFMNRLDAAGREYWSAYPPHAGQSLSIVAAVKPGGVSRFWLDSSPGGLDAGALAPFAERLSRLPVPVVHGGPVAFAARATLWGGLPNVGWEFIPAEWMSRCSGQDLIIPDGVLGVVWPDTEQAAPS